MADSKTQPWKAAWPVDENNKTSSSSIEYGVSKGDVAVVDGTAANVKPTARVTSDSASSKAQPWKASWPGADTPSSASGNEYGVAKGDTVVVDGTAANVKPSTRKTVRVVRQ
ncbi:hypothetical protein Sste5346_003321 [Sporothrix stenoceras]|uniref:Hypervirulence associated protein TUDOR domain-containing protein n=1 Tax=Sporothrix stenoceras TaxID=5173 RepID=A0ABR3ZEV7_9PEZI